MKKLSIFLLILLSIFTVGCGNNVPSTTKYEDMKKDEVKDEKPVEPKPAAQKISAIPSIGAKRSEFPTNDDNIVVVFDNYMVTFIDDLAVRVDTNTTTFDKNLVASLLPTDLQKVEEFSTQEMGMKKSRYVLHSDLLAKVYPQHNGDFIMVTNYDAQTGAYLGTIIDASSTKEDYIENP